MIQLKQKEIVGLDIQGSNPEVRYEIGNFLFSNASGKLVEQLDCSGVRSFTFCYVEEYNQCGCCRLELEWHQ